MTEIFGIDHLPEDVRKFITTTVQTHGSLNYINFRRAKDDSHFELIKYGLTHRQCPMHLKENTQTARLVVGDEVFHDVWELHFSAEKQEAQLQFVGKIDVDDLPATIEVKDSKAKGGGGATWEGYPMADDIPFREAMYATCKMGGVFLDGKKLVLRNGAWHRK